MNNIYLVGIKGVGMTALAVYLKERGNKVLGCDIKEVFPTDEVLQANGIRCIEGFIPENITDDIDLVITTGAHGGLNNIEVQEAKRRNISVKTLAQYVGEETKYFKTTISVCGTHGKTTTSAMIAFVFSQLGLKSSHLVGVSKFSGLSGGHYGGDDYLVVEADEYVSSIGVDDTPRFMYQDPDIIICTNVEHDHPDAFPTEEDLEQAYMDFFKKLDTKQKVLIYCKKDKRLQKLVSELDIEQKFPYSESIISLSIPGRHNMLNAGAILTLASVLKLDEEKVKRALKLFSGSDRRFEKIYEYNGVVLIDDYAHHPTEIIATIETARQVYPGRRLVLIFQSHTYSRTKQFFSEFISALTKADRVFITDIFASARETKQDITAQDMVSAVQDSGFFDIFYYPFKLITPIVQKQLRRGDIIITMGAGALYQIHAGLIDAIEKIK